MPGGHTDAGTDCDPGGTPPPGRSLGKDYFSGLLYFIDKTGNSVYHGLTVQAIYSLNRSFRINVNYIFSNTLDDGQHTAESPIVRGFEFSGIVKAETGRPFTEFVGFDSRSTLSSTRG